MKMENETKIFVAWLIKLIKKDKKIKGKALASLVGCDASTISGYIRGRTKPNFEIRQAILEATGTDYADMLAIGRRELQPAIQPDILKRLEKLEEKHIQPPNITDFQAAKNREHHEKINEFQNHEIALKINNTLVAIEKLDPEALEEIEKTLQIKFEALAKKHNHEPKTTEPGERSGKRA